MGLGLAQPKAQSIWAGPIQIGHGLKQFGPNLSLRNGFGFGPAQRKILKYISFTLDSKGVFTWWSILASILTIIVRIVVILASIEPIL